MSYPKRYQLALRSALIITVFTTGGTGLLLYFFEKPSVVPLLVFGLISFSISFIVLQSRVERFIYGWVKSIYKDLRVLDETNLPATAITTDMETLSKEVERYAETKKRQIESLNVRENYRKEYMGNVAHELKTPLFTAQGYILTLLDGAKDNPKVLTKYLDGASNAVDRLVRIVDDLDMISRLEAGELVLNRTDFDIIELIQETFSLLEMNGKEKNIKLVFDQVYSPIRVHADRDRMAQVLINILVNSQKYGKKNGTTEVSIEDFSAHKILIRITDNGEGIPENNLHRIFERFYRVDQSGARTEGGSGLGLAIVKHIVEAHFEKIYIESQFGIGSEFSFTLQKSQKPS